LDSIRKRAEVIGHIALRKLRKNKLDAGHPFIINSSKLPSNQCYFEFPDGTFQVVAICHIDNDFKAVRTLTKRELTALKKLLAPIC
jgi:hypothetical protein